MKFIRAFSTILFAGHVLLAMALKDIAGVSITANPNGLTTWGDYWQNLPVVDLRERLVESLWNLHAQPPLHNLYGAVFIHLFPEQYLQAMHYANSVLGALLCAMSAVILWRVTRSRWATLTGGLFITLNPGLFLYEAYMLYTLPATFLIVLCVFCIALSHDRPVWLYGFVLAANLLVLVRSLYHPIFLLVIILMAAVFSGTRWKRTMVIAAAISLLGFGWATKNALQYGFWGTSSWGGLNLWRVASWNYTPPVLEGLAKAGVIDPLVVELGPFSYPSSYVSYGFDAETPVQSLSRDNYHNLNIPAIAQVYQRSALALMRYDPGVYVRQVLSNYNLYTCPASAFRHNQINREHLPALVQFYEDGLYGAPLFQSFNWTVAGHAAGCSVQYFILPLSLLAYGCALIWQIRRQRWQVFSVLREDRIVVMLAVFVAYNTLAGTLFEVEENARFKFMIEALLWIFVVSLCWRGIIWLRSQDFQLKLPVPASAVTPEPALPVTQPVSSPEAPITPATGQRSSSLAYLIGGVLMLVGVVMLIWQLRDQRQDPQDPPLTP